LKCNGFVCGSNFWENRRCLHGRIEIGVVNDEGRMPPSSSPSFLMVGAHCR
jgi:hypothetical protein